MHASASNVDQVIELGNGQRQVDKGGTISDTMRTYAYRPAQFAHIITYNGRWTDGQMDE
jgi:hypothetical protein